MTRLQALAYTSPRTFRQAHLREHDALSRELASIIRVTLADSNRGDDRWHGVLSELEYALTCCLVDCDEADEDICLEQVGGYQRYSGYWHGTEAIVVVRWHVDLNDGHSVIRPWSDIDLYIREPQAPQM